LASETPETAANCRQEPFASGTTTDVAACDRPLAAPDSGEAIRDWLDATVNDDVHAAGTCRMGQPDDPAAVVDTACRVIGVDGLRVCDASVMPDLPRANTHLTTVAIAERAVMLMRSVLASRV
jgi:5-(hydroxymethyl)furfural/furfural oxidase